MRSGVASLALALVLLVPTGNAAAVFVPDESTNSIIADINASDSADVNVYDYTTVGTAWTPLILATVAEFNAVSPVGVPQLRYVTASGDADCLDLPDDVWDLTGIIVCDTNRPEDFPYDPNAPVDGWGGSTQARDDDTTVIVLNNFVPDGYYIPDEKADNTVCHEMMHAYTGVGDAYNSDASGSCVWGDLLSPGSTDLRLMRERYPTTVASSSRPDEEPSLWERTKAVGREVGVRVCDAIPHVDISFLWEGTKATGRDVRDRLSDVMPNVDIDIPGMDIPLPHPGLNMPDVNLPTCKATD
jgi:hypothetical protein